MAEKIDLPMEVDLRGEYLHELPPECALALATRAAWRVLPLAYDIPEQRLHDVAAALAVSGRYSFGDIDRASTLGELLVSTVPFTLIADTDSLAYKTVASAVLAATNDGAIRISHAYVAVDTSIEAAVIVAAKSDVSEAIKADINWLRDWAGQKHADFSLVGPDFFQRPLWLRSFGELPPENLLLVIEQWTKAAYSAGLEWLVEQHERLLKGGGFDVERQLVYLDEWYRENQTRAEHLTEGADEDAEPSDVQSESEEVVQPETQVRGAPVFVDTQLLPGGIVTAAADIPALTDHLGRKPLVDTLADMLSSPKQSLPMTIALLGDWGSGKTSVIEQLMARLEELAKEDQKQSAGGDERKRNQYLFATFNAWEYEQTDNLRAGLAQEVVRGLTHNLSGLEKFALAIRKAMQQNSLEFWQTVLGTFLALVGIIWGIDMATPDDLGMALQSDQFAFANSNPIGGGSITAFGLYLLLHTWRMGRRLLEHPLAEQMATYLKLPDYGKQLGEVPLIKEEIKFLCKERLKSLTNGRLLVIVDDLDRCHPEAVIDTLDAIRLVMNLDNVAVIVAIDDRIAFRAVAEHYKELAQDGMRSKEEVARDYLGKIIQLPVNLYQPWPDEVELFIHEHLFQVSEDMDVPSEPAPNVQSEEIDTAPSDVPSDVSSNQAETKISIAALKLIQENTLDAAAINGSGVEGRIIKKDVQDYLEMMDETARLEELHSEKVEKEKPRTQEQVAQEHDKLQQLAEEIRREAETSLELAEEVRREAGVSLEREKVMEDTAFERDLFAELSRDMDFHNPRQLIRLHNSYRLLKGYRHSREAKPVDTLWVRFLMHGLFWYEFLYQQKLADRQLAELVAWEWPSADWEKKAARKEAEAKEKNKKLEESGDKRAEGLANPPVVNMSRRLNSLLDKDAWIDSYPGLMQTVAMVVLPNAQVGLLLKRHDVDEVLKGQIAKYKGQQLDPWNLYWPEQQKRHEVSSVS